MPPKTRVTKDDILNAAVNIVRNSGAEALNARTIASMLNCSTQPIFSNFATMETLRMAVVEKADTLCSAYMQQEMQRGEFPAYKATGMAYIRFAKEERELFKLLYMRDRTHEFIPETTAQTEQMETIVQKNTGLSGEEARLFHMEMWAYVHGIATMFATGFFDLEWEVVSRILTDAYQGLRKQHGMEG